MKVSDDRSLNGLIHYVLDIFAVVSSLNKCLVSHFVGGKMLWNSSLRRLQFFGFVGGGRQCYEC